MNPLMFIPIAIFVLYILNSIKILPEYERGVIFRLGRLLPEPKGPGIFLVFAPLDKHGARLAAAGSAGGSAAGHHHPRQRHPEGERGHLPARRRSAVARSSR